MQLFANLPTFRGFEINTIWVNSIKRALFKYDLVDSCFSVSNDKILPCVPEIVTFMYKNIELPIFCCLFGFEKKHIKQLITQKIMHKHEIMYQTSSCRHVPG